MPELVALRPAKVAVIPCSYCTDGVNEAEVRSHHGGIVTTQSVTCYVCKGTSELHRQDSEGDCLTWLAFLHFDHFRS